MREIITNLKMTYSGIKVKIENKLKSFKSLNRRQVMKELIFCILTPQSEAKRCWDSVLNLEKKSFPKTQSEILDCLNGVRFKRKKAYYIEKNLQNFDDIYKEIKKGSNSFVLREYIVEKVCGMGWKEASHFLRNIGRGENFAILDRHILKCLKKYGQIKEIPASISKKKYIVIENKMKEFAKKINIPVSHLDFLFWYIEKGEIFK